MSDVAGDQPVTIGDLGPVFEVVGQRLSALEKAHSEINDVLMKIVGGFGDAVTQHKRDGFSSLLSTKHGGDLAELGDPYKEIYGSDLSDDLMSKLMDGSLGEDGIADHLGGIKAKFAKIRMPAAGGEVEPKAEVSVAEAPAEDATDTEAEDAPEEDEGGFAGPGSDVLKSMMSDLKKAPDILKGRAKRR